MCESVFFLLIRESKKKTTKSKQKQNAPCSFFLATTTLTQTDRPFHRSPQTLAFAVKSFLEQESKST